MGHEHDFWEPLRRAIVPKVGLVFAVLEDLLSGTYYENTEQRRKQFVGRAKMGEESFETVLHGAGYERNPVSWLKENRAGETEEGSWRKPVGDMQVHLILYDGECIPNADAGEVYLYAHWEYRWDTHPIKHLIGETVDCGEGVRRVQKMLQNQGVEYDFIQP